MKKTEFLLPVTLAMFIASGVARAADPEIIPPPPIDGPGDRFDTLTPHMIEAESGDKKFYELVRAGKLKEALAEANRVIPADPSAFDLHHLRTERVWLELLVGDVRRAEAAVSRLEKVEPDSSTVLLMKGHIALFKNDTQTARQLFAKVLKDDPTAGQRTYDYGKRLYDRGSLQAAWVQFSTAQAMDPWKTPFAGYYKGAIAEKSGNFAAAVGQYEAFLRINPSGPQAEQARGRLKHLRSNDAP